MASADVQAPPAEAAPAVPDYLASPNAVFGDEGVQWRYGKAPDYSKTRKVWEEGKKMNHAAGSLPQLVENLVKNWEVEASFKPRLSDWRTIDHANYTFAINGGPPQSAEHMLKVGTYNAIIAPNEYYSPENSDFASSHKTFKRMMPTFAWEVTEVYSGPPKVAFKWRHWGQMKNDYVGFNDKGEKITAKAHGGPIEIYGVTVAQVDDAVRLQSVDTWFDPLEMFRQIAPGGIVNKTIMNKNVDKSAALEEEHKLFVPTTDGVKIAEHHANEAAHADEKAPEDLAPKHVSTSTDEPADAFVPHQGAGTSKSAVDEDHSNGTTEPVQSVVDIAATKGASAPLSHPTPNTEAGENNPVNPMAPEQPGKPTSGNPDIPKSQYSSAVTGSEEAVLAAASDPSYKDESRTTGTHDAIDEHLEGPADKVHPYPHNAEDAVHPQPGQAVAAEANSRETRLTHEEMSSLGAGECPFLMNRE